MEKLTIPNNHNIKLLQTDSKTVALILTLIRFTAQTLI